MTDHRKHRTLCGVESRCFMQTALRRKTETANEKDPSTALGMTIPGEGGSVPPSPPRLFSPFKYPHRMAAGAGCIFGVFGMV